MRRIQICTQRMPRYLIFTAKLFLFWLLLFAACRAAFMLCYADMLKGAGVSLSELPAVFVHALHLDISAACYFCIVPMLLLIVQAWLRRSFVLPAIMGYMAFAILLWCVICVSEAAVYGEWQHKLGYKAWLILRQPAEVARSAGAAKFIALLLTTLCCAALITIVCRKCLRRSHFPRIKWYAALPFTILAPPLLVVGMRGGLQNFPIHQAQSYFSSKQILNDIAVNSAWNLIHSITHGARALQKNNYATMPPQQADSIVAALFANENDTAALSILRIPRPNIVLLILESWTADMVESLGGAAGITSNFAALEKEGILFTRIYSSGKRSPEGMAALLAGYPAMPQITAVDFPEKFRHAAALPRRLAQQGYHTSYYYGGYSEYGNILAFIRQSGFAKIWDGPDIAKCVSAAQIGALGIHDEWVLQKQLSDLNETPQPFFSALFTLSTHAPYDHPALPNNIDKSMAQSDFLNSVYYADYCLGRYFEQARRQAWFDNTLFILAADHSRASHIARPYHDFGSIGIPILFYGSAIKEKQRGTRQEEIGSSHDLAATLLGQMGLTAGDFRWSKDLLRRRQHNFAFHADHDGIRWKCGHGSFAYDYGAGHFIYMTAPERDSAQMVREGFAFMQALFDEFINM